MPEAIGRINIAGYRTRRMCTGTLVWPDLVLTAAHCLRDPRSGRDFDPARVNFVAGWSQGDYAAHARGVEVLAPSGAPALARDAALVRLPGPVDIAPIPVAAAPAPGTAVTVVSYARSRPHLPARADCTVIRRQGPVFGLDCPAEPGQSGAPVLVRAGEEWRLAGILSARADGTAGIGSYAVALDPAAFR
ncbi:trypsin-like serine peptidase [Tranquillimonas alkanivorans]|uniref:Trypsin-like peptidase domain-containing protein n=1 Tax=Tranquillimonas alkanivorans TaxID=441119 RepID=A0A1I5QVK2_9RHOB|nr:trypsin-like peptidase domain-containing protein [Tranquillimonas alkanivorans]SFP50285.1 Trypsin-like peptidase domain-containing protein [Tranquillimonas alkanivorans]